MVIMRVKKELLTQIYPAGLGIHFKLLLFLNETHKIISDAEIFGA